MAHQFRSVIAAGLLFLCAPVLNAAQLVMVEQRGCHYCELWEKEIEPAYDKTAEGQFAPLIKHNLREGAPDGMTFQRKVRFTPTFVLVEDGAELARIEGYPGPDFFWPLLNKLLTDKTDFAKATD